MAELTGPAGAARAPRPALGFPAVPKRLYMPIVVGLAGAALVGLLVYGVAVQAPTRTLDEAVARRTDPPAPSAGDQLPVLSGSGYRSLASYSGKVVVLNFWASWCEPCQQEAPRLERAQHELSRHGGTVLGVTFRDSSPDSLSFVKRYRLTYPNLDDTTGEFAHSYGTNALPESFVIDRHGHIVAISRQEASTAFLSRAVSLGGELVSLGRRAIPLVLPAMIALACAGAAAPATGTSAGEQTARTPAGEQRAGTPAGRQTAGTPAEGQTTRAPGGGQTAGAPAAKIAPRTTLPVIERQVMCATCKIPLNVAESPQADRERAFIRDLIAEGQTEAQIKSALVGQYGPAVLALPSAKGFDLAAYLVPAAVVLALLALLAILLPSWRRHARTQALTSPDPPELSASDAARLDADLKRFD